jgi:hypothetical protein
VAVTLLAEASRPVLGLGDTLLAALKALDTTRTGFVIRNLDGRAGYLAQPAGNILPREHPRPVHRLVGGGSGACLGGLQAGGMGEGWGDFMGSSFLNNPVVGAYVTGNATVGIRRMSMANSTFT